MAWDRTGRKVFVLSGIYNKSAPATGIYCSEFWPQSDYPGIIENDANRRRLDLFEA